MERRSFIKTIAWISTGIFLSRCRPAKSLATGGKSLRGTVTSNGKGVKDVIVSDGYSVVATDKHGVYEIIPDPGAVTIFMSIPAGYEFPVEKGIAKHYHLLQPGSTPGNLNFELVPLTGSDDDHQFIIWADPQVKNKSDVAKMMRESVPAVQKFVAAAAPGTLLHGITVGDLAWDNLEFFSDYNVAVAKMGLPFFQCLGNHDMDYRKGGDETSDDTFTLTYGPTTYSFNRGQVHYIVMDDVRYLGTERDYDGYFQKHHLEWLQKDLAFVPKEKLIVLCAHIPVNRVKNNTELYSILEGRNVHIMTGHTHWNDNQIKDNIYEHNHGTVCGAWWTGTICEDGTPNGYGIYKVKGNDISWHYQAMGKDEDYQFRVYVNDLNASQKQVIVNIWNYDPEWKNEYWIDGASKGALEQFEGFDPLAYQTMLGPNLPSSRGFAEPHKTNHLFRAVIPASAKQLQVAATDRFGKVYKQIQVI